MDNYLDKGRFGELLASFPLSIIKNSNVGLLGASLFAQKLAKLK
jgi:glucokinase